MRWRVIMTDTESLSGVAPVCPDQNDITKHATAHDELDPSGVYDCCPHPHLECGSRVNALRVVDVLNYFNVEVCT